MSNPVEDLLKAKGVYYTYSGKDFLTKCLNPDHTDTNPSFRIDKVTGICHCFSCGFKANIFKHFGVLTNISSIRVAKLKEKLMTLRISNEGLEPLKGAKPFNTSYRGIAASTLKHFGACTTDMVEEMVDRIVFPITDIRDKTVAYVGRNRLSDTGQRYANYPVGASVPLFPAKLANKPTSIVLVEGLFDMLNLHDKGLTNTVCCFGTQKLFKDTADKLFQYKVMGVQRVFILYDGDDAGRTAADTLKPLLEAAEFITEIIKLEDGTDPGDLSSEDVQQLIEYTR